MSKKYEIYIGLKDKDTYEELITVDEFAKMVEEHCSKKETGFSLSTQVGGYSHNQGYVTETSLRITLFGIDEKDVKELGKVLKEKVNTDTIMITSEDSEHYYY